MTISRAILLRLFAAFGVACALVVVGACSLGPKQDDPLGTTGGIDSGGPQDAAIGPDGFGADTSTALDTGKTSEDTPAPFDDCDGGDADADGGCKAADGGDADAPSDAPTETATDAPSDAVDEGDAGDAVVGE